MIRKSRREKALTLRTAHNDWFRTAIEGRTSFMAFRSKRFRMRRARSSNSSKNSKI